MASSRVVTLPMFVGEDSGGTSSSALVVDSRCLLDRGDCLAARPGGRSRLARRWFAEPSRGGLSGLLMVGGDLTGEGNEAIGAYQHSPQAQPILRLARDIDDPPAPTTCKRPKRCARVEVQEQAFPLSQEIAHLRPV